MNFEEAARGFVEDLIRTQADYEKSIQAAVLRLQAAVVVQVHEAACGEKPKEQPVPQSLMDIEKQPLGNWYAAQILMSD